MRNREDLIKNTIQLSACCDQFVASGVSLLDRILDHNLETCEELFTKIMDAIDQLKRNGLEDDNVTSILVATFAAGGFGVCMEKICERAIGGNDDE